MFRSLRRSWTTFSILLVSFRISMLCVYGLKYTEKGRLIDLAKSLEEKKRKLTSFFFSSQLLKKRKLDFWVRENNLPHFFFGLFKTLWNKVSFLESSDKAFLQTGCLWIECFHIGLVRESMLQNTPQDLLNWILILLCIYTSCSYIQLLYRCAVCFPLIGSLSCFTYSVFSVWKVNRICYLKSSYCGRFFSPY